MFQLRHAALEPNCGDSAGRQAPSLPRPVSGLVIEGKSSARGPAVWVLTCVEVRHAIPPNLEAVLKVAWPSQLVWFFKNRSGANSMFVSTGSAENRIRWPDRRGFKTDSKREQGHGFLFRLGAHEGLEGNMAKGNSARLGHLHPKLP
jgi:hypothetical protein